MQTIDTIDSLALSVRYLSSMHLHGGSLLIYDVWANPDQLTAYAQVPFVALQPSLNTKTYTRWVARIQHFAW